MTKKDRGKEVKILYRRWSQWSSTVSELIKKISDEQIMNSEQWRGQQTGV